MTQEENRYPPQQLMFKPVKAIIIFLIRILTKIHILGLENVPAEGRIIFVSNHLHYLDTPVVGVHIPRPEVHPIAAMEYEKHPLFGTILRLTGAIFINRGEADRNALRMAMNVLEDDLDLAIAVEGTRSDTGALASGKSGAAYLATRTDTMLVPIVVWGSEKIVSSWSRLKRADVYVRFGEPFQLPEGRARTAKLIEYTDNIIMVKLASLLPEEYRGIYKEHPLVVGHEMGSAS